MTSRAFLFIVLIFVLAAPAGLEGQPVAAAAAGTSQHDALVAKCLTAANVRTAQLADGSMRFVGTAAGKPVPQPTALPDNASAEQAARIYLGACRSLFGLQDVTAQLATTRSSVLADGRSVVRFQQLYQGLPVLAGELVVNLDAQKNILAITNKATTVKLESVTPHIAIEAARQLALLAVAKDFQLEASALTAKDLGLWIYQPALLNPSDTDPAVLVWRFEVTASGAPVDEVVLVNAQRAAIALKFNQVDTWLQTGTNTASAVATTPAPKPVAPAAPSVLGTPQVSVFNMNHSVNEAGLPGTFLCSEGNPAPCNSDTDASYAFAYAWRTALYYAVMFGRDSINGAGMRIVSSVHYGSGYQNAFWNGAQMVYGDGFSTAEDVVGHELTHGVTQYESGLFYYYQSGAINESVSDVFGELIEKYYDGDTDWLLGENLPVGAGRDMANPSAYGQPDKMSSLNYYTGSDDNGGVHENSGISNKAAYLMADGGSFNGYTVTGLGTAKVARIYYEANTNLLTSGSDYFDLYQALFQACVNLSIFGTGGVTSADCTQVLNAVNAVEMANEPVTNFNPDAPLCSYPLVPTYSFNDSFENGTGNFVSGVLAGNNPWYLLDGNILAHTGVNAVADDDLDSVSASYIRTPAIYIPSGAYLRFDHVYDLEPGYDGGVVEWSNNGGASWNDAGPLFDYNGYDDVISTAWGNPIGGRWAFTGISHGYVESRLNLAALAGQTVMFRWLQGTDAGIGNLAWVLDDIRVYTCRTNTHAKYDFDGNGTTDVSLFRSSNSNWYAYGLFGSGFGATGDIPVPADYNGDGKADVAVFRPSNGTWYVKDQFGVQFGTSGDIPVPADYNGDGKAEIAVFRPSTGVWYIRGVGAVAFGASGDTPVPADYNGDGQTDIAVYRSGIWYIRNQAVVAFGGVPGDIPVPADYNGDGLADIAIYRSGMWYVLGQFATGFGGVPGDIPVQGDYNGDGHAEIAIYRSGMWYMYGVGAVAFGGAPGDIPLPGK